MTCSKHSAKKAEGKERIRELFGQDGDLLRELMQMALQQVLETEMEEAVGTGKWEQSPQRVGYRAGYSQRSLRRVAGKIELRVPQDRRGRFRTEVFERYQPGEKALVSAIVEMYVEGASTRKVEAITEELCGQEFSSATISRMVGRLDEELERFAQRRLERTIRI